MLDAYGNAATPDGNAAHGQDNDASLTAEQLLKRFRFSASETAQTLS